MTHTLPSLEWRCSIYLEFECMIWKTRTKLVCLIWSVTTIRNGKDQFHDRFKIYVRIVFVYIFWRLQWIIDSASFLEKNSRVDLLLKYDHEKGHVGKAPHMCCSKRFYSKANLKRPRLEYFVPIFDLKLWNNVYNYVNLIFIMK